MRWLMVDGVVAQSSCVKIMLRYSLRVSIVSTGMLLANRTCRKKWKFQIEEFPILAKTVLFTDDPFPSVRKFQTLKFKFLLHLPTGWECWAGPQAKQADQGRELAVKWYIIVYYLTFYLRLSIRKIIQGLTKSPIYFKEEKSNLTWWLRKQDPTNFFVF